MRLAHTALGGLAAMGWLLLPAATGSTIGGQSLEPGAGGRGVPSASGERTVGADVDGESPELGAGRRGVPSAVGERPVGADVGQGPAPPAEGEQSVVAAGRESTKADAGSQALPPRAGRQSVAPASDEQTTAPATDRQPVEQPAGPAGGQPVAPALGGSLGVAASGTDEASAAELVLPVAAAGVAVAVAVYSLVRRRRRAQLRTTPTGAFEAPVTSLPDLHRRAQRLLVDTDDSVRTSAEELRFAAARPGRTATEPDPADPDEAEPHAQTPAAPDTTQPSPARPMALDTTQPYAETPSTQDPAQPFVEALADARRALGVAFQAGQRLDDEADALSPDEERALLEEILTRCTTAQRRLDTATPAFDQLRALERDITPALVCAEARFRELTGRTATAATTLSALRDGYAPAAVLPVTGYVEQAKDRLVFATAELNRARQAAYPGDLTIAAVHLRAAEGAIDQADVFVTGVERLAVELARATEAAKRGAPFAGPYDDPLDVLRRQGRWFLPAHSAVAAATDFVTTHRGAVGFRARTRLAEAARHLAQADSASPDTDTEADTEAGAAAPPAATETTPHSQRALNLALAHAQEARQLAEQDVRAYGNPYGGPVGDGLAGALLGGILLGEAPGGGGRGDPRGPACFGGTATRGRRTVGGQF
ncbi:hypothetical protein [Streptomyces adelaidensis]|uniref:hypothetical protein n=1 Tax=Streptomyces adelaidensis TaxID=2796465 RepID=UPI0019055112|nr:hypothetical protein [Streptomyces adelaidensis]